MNKNEHTRHLLRFAALGGMALVLVGCDSIREAAGVTKEPPDEFAVVTKAPLVMPPDYNLRPPKPGAAPTNQYSPTESAAASMFGEDPAEIAKQMTGDYSQEEKLILATSGAAVSDHAIRQQLAADAKSMEATNDDLTNKLLFQTGPDPQAGNPLDSDSEKQRLDAAKSSQQTNSTVTPDDAKDNKDSATIDKSGNGWLDGIF
jgi:Protein of unknown function (DUF3035)